ncbi:MAG: ferritin-like domain-containing protein [Nannocystaceae bacterium]
MTDPYRLLLLSIFAATIGGCTEESTACIAIDPEVLECPAPEDVDKDDLQGGCGSKIRRILGEGDRVDNISQVAESEADFVPGCCYPVKETRETCAYGRPLRVDAARVVAAGEGGESEWAAALSLRASTLAPALRAALTERWTQAALDEHASVAAFSKIALDLLRHDAPPELIAGAHQAALDEIRHANHGFAIASAIAGAPVRPGPYPLGSTLPLAEDLAAVAVEAVRDGCVGETVAALLAREAAARCEEPTIRRVLLGIADDEERHAILGWRTLAWALRRGGAEVRAAVVEVFEGVAREGVEVPLVGACDDPIALAEVGLLDRDGARRHAAAVLRRVILPAASRILGELGQAPVDLTEGPRLDA